MKIFYEGNKIRLQLMDMRTRSMLFDFVIEKDDWKELKNHVIEHLEQFDKEKFF